MGKVELRSDRVADPLAVRLQLLMPESIRAIGPRELLGRLGVIRHADADLVSGTRGLVWPADPARMDSAGAAIATARDYGIDVPDETYLVAHPTMYDQLLALARAELEARAGDPRSSSPEPEPPRPAEIVGAAAAGRVLGKSARTVRRWLDRCPADHWPDASRPAGPPAWSSPDAVRAWWSGRLRWPAEAEALPATPRSAARPRKSEPEPVGGKLRNRLLRRVREDG